MMDLRSGMPYHWIFNGLPVEYPQLDHDVKCSALVVGGGITGALCARALATAALKRSDAAIQLSITSVFCLYARSIAWLYASAAVRQEAFMPVRID